jgi:hypothetical protein
MVAHMYNLSYLEGKDQKDPGSRPVKAGGQLWFVHFSLQKNKISVY